MSRVEKAVKELTVAEMKLFGRSAVLSTVTLWQVSMKPMIESMKELGSMFGEPVPDDLEDKFLELMQDVMPKLIGHQMGRMYQNTGQFYADLQQGTVVTDIMAIEEELAERTRELFGGDTL